MTKFSSTAPPNCLRTSYLDNAPSLTSFITSTRLNRLTDTNFLHTLLNSTQTNICPFTKYCPKMDHFTQSIKSIYHILEDDRGIGSIFVQTPVYACKQPPNLCQLLVRNTITDDKPECNKPCGKQRCTVCKHIDTATEVFINHKTFTPGNYDCDSANVVYLIHCQKCPEAQYIGETGGNLY